MEASAAVLIRSLTLAGFPRGCAGKMDKRENNPFMQAIFCLLAGFLFSACRSMDVPVLVGQNDLAVPAVSVITHTPRPKATIVSTLVPGLEGEPEQLVTRSPVIAEPTAIPELLLYEVQAGDWMVKIARQFGVTLQALMEINPGVNPQYLQPGEQLVLPLTGTPPPAAALEGALESGFASVPADLAGLAEQVFGVGLPLQVIIPVIGIEVDVIAVGWHTEETANGKTVLWHSPGNSAGFLVSSAAPGAGGNAVFYGHHNIHGSVFRGLDRLKPGDVLSVRNVTESLDYVVEQVDVFEEHGLNASQKLVHMQYFAPTVSEQITLLTCWPFTGNSHRVAVVARPIE